MKTFKIAATAIPGVAFADESLAGLTQELTRYADLYSVKIDRHYAATKSAMATVMDEIIDHDYDLIFSVGAMFSQTAYSALLDRKKNIPLVFAGVINPVDLKLVPSENKPKGMVTGVTFDDLNPSTIIHALLYLKPTIKRVLLPWEPTGNGGRMDQAVAQATAALESKGIHVQKVTIESADGVVDTIAPFCSNIDTLIVLPGSALSEAIDDLIALANKHAITLAAYALTSAKRGAAIAWGAFYHTIGIAGAQQVHDILHHGTHPGAIPVHRLTDWYHIAVNAKAAGQQDLPLSDPKLFLLKNSVVI